MKSMIKRIIVGVSIALIMYFLTGCNVVHAAQQFTYITPQQSFISYCDKNTNACNYSLTSTLRSSYEYFSTWYIHDVNLPVDNYINRLSWKFDLSNIDGDYLTFTVLYNNSTPSATLDGRPCEVFYGQNLFLNFFNVLTNGTQYDYEYVQIPNGYNIVSCYNSKTADSWLDLYYHDKTNTSWQNRTFSSYIINWTNTYNKYGEITTAIDKNTDAIKETNDFLKDTSTPNSSDISNVTDNITSQNANISDLVLLPVSAINVFSQGLSGACTAYYDLGNLLGTNLRLSCINPENYLGSVLWATIDIMFTLGFIWVFKNWLINKYFELTSLKEAKFR